METKLPYLPCVMSSHPPQARGPWRRKWVPRICPAIAYASNCAFTLGDWVVSAVNCEAGSGSDHCTGTSVTPQRAMHLLETKQLLLKALLHHLIHLKKHIKSRFFLIPSCISSNILIRTMQPSPWRFRDDQTHKNLEQKKQDRPILSHLKHSVN